MSKVKVLKASNNLNNIPHMLRNLANEIESGVTETPRTLFVIAIGDGNAPPDLYQFGSEISRLEEAGAFAACSHLVLQTEHEQ